MYVREEAESDGSSVVNEMGTQDSHSRVLVLDSAFPASDTTDVAGDASVPDGNVDVVMARENDSSVSFNPDLGLGLNLDEVSETPGLSEIDEEPAPEGREAPAVPGGYMQDSLLLPEDIGEGQIPSLESWATGQTGVSSAASDTSAFNLFSLSAEGRGSSGPSRSELLSFTVPPPEWISAQPPGFEAVVQPLVAKVQEYQRDMVAELRASLAPLSEWMTLPGFGCALLPPNLRDLPEEVSVGRIRSFLETESIPLYLVPRARTAVRLLRAEDWALRREVLTDRYESLIDDCAEVLEAVTSEAVLDDARGTLDGIGAMRAGYLRPAQTMFTVTLDSLIYRHFPLPGSRSFGGGGVRRVSAWRGEDADVHEAMVWLPIWNAHERFWKHKEHRDSFAAALHEGSDGIPSRQFSKRNCVQVLMLLTSLIGFINDSTMRFDLPLLSPRD